MRERGEHSLRRRLLLRVGLPMLAVLLGSAVAAYALARHFAEQVYDRWLWDSAMSLATLVRYENGHAAIDPTPSVVRMFEWDSVDRIRSSVTSQRHGRLFGSAAIPPPPAQLAATDNSRYYDARIDGEPVRVVAVDFVHPDGIGDTLTVEVAETRHKRTALATQLLLASIPLQAGVLLLAALLIWAAVRSSLRTLDTAARQLAEYDPDRLAPLTGLADSPREIRPLAHALDDLIRRLADAQDAQRRFVANAAHQLRTPLATLQVQAERALREVDPTRHREALSHLLTALTRLGHLGHQLLTLSRSEAAAESALALRELDLAELARDELERWIDPALAQGADLGYDGPERGVPVRGEPQLLRELIGNLLDNALRYGRRDGMITLGVRANPPRLYVEDDGPGIAVAEHGLVLERFYRVPGSPGDGCGLGLAIAREIAARHDAVLAFAEPAHGHGTRVQVGFARATQSG